jgi:hypothetical protein
MTNPTGVPPLRLPERLLGQLDLFRRSLWKVKLVEAACAAVTGLLAAWLLLFVADRLIDPGHGLRWLLWGAGLAVAGLIPWTLHRWIWQHRRPEQLARLISRRFPTWGDQLLGVIELTRNDLEQTRSRALCEAAIEQVASESSRRDVATALPPTRLSLFRRLAVGGAVLVGALTLALPAAAWPTWARLLAPWSAVPRYTFAAVEPLPTQVVVPQGEPFTVQSTLWPWSRWIPAQGEATVAGQPAVAAPPITGNYPFDRTAPDQVANASQPRTAPSSRYSFEFPGLLEPSTLRLKVGDYRQTVPVVPLPRPELTDISAEITLPAYLQRTQPVVKDLRSGALSVVQGSEVAVRGTMSRELRQVTLGGQSQPVSGRELTIARQPVTDRREVSLEWRDEHGLAGREPFQITLSARPDEAPSLAAEGLPRQKVLLDSETLSFQVRARDDFGLKQVGIEWAGVPSATGSQPAQGERVLGAGAPDREALDLAATFSAKSLGIPPQPLQVRIFAEDYLPERGRVYSPVFLLYVMSPEEHAIWVAEQLHKWHRQSLEVRDRELQLHETNKELRSLSDADLRQPDTLRRLEAQATAERANGRRLSALSAAGEDLLRQAARNPELGVGNLEKWAEMLQVLQDISANRMPSVADLLKQAAQPGQSLAANSSKPGPQVGQNRDPQGGAGQSSKPQPNRPAAPTVSDRESSQQPKPPGEAGDSGEKKPSSPATLRLPTTTLAGGKPAKPNQPDQDGANPPLEQAVEEQRDLLAEFEKLSEEMNRVLANLEGSTLVKRLKAASRLQNDVATKLGGQVAKNFGRRGNLQGSGPLQELSDVEGRGSQDVSIIMDDLQSYYDRRRLANFRTVLEEMRQADVVGQLRTLADDLLKHQGLAISQAEFWSDNLDRWAEDLVDAAKGGKCPGCQSRGSLPPSIVLEVMQILEAEVNLREETRVAQQARSAVTPEEHQREADRQSQVQGGLRERVDAVSVRIRELAEAEELFGRELALMAKVSEVMEEATEILTQGETGPQAIAAETEAIELLLATRRMKPGGGGGSGSTPGGGGGGDTKTSALAMLGRGVNEKEVREERDVGQASGQSGPVLPEEFRAGLDEFFNRLESR